MYSTMPNGPTSIADGIIQPQPALGKPLTGYLIEWHWACPGSALPLGQIQVGVSQMECLAHVLGVVTEAVVWPTEVTYEESTARTELWLKDQLLAVIRPAGSTRTDEKNLLMDLEAPRLAGCAQKAAVTSLRAVHASVAWRNRVAVACSRDYVAGLRALFMLDATEDQRVQFSAAETGRVVVAVDGAWTILLDDEVPDQPSKLWFMLSRTNGAEHRVCTCELHKVVLRDFLGDLVVTSECQRAVALLKGLSPSVTRTLCALCMGDYDLPDLEPGELAAETQFLHLCERAGEAGALMAA